MVEVEEGYTSKASFIDNDTLPTLSAKNNNNNNNNNNKEHIFSGKRIKRGLYKFKNGTLLNADVNGAANILRKVFLKVKG